jgi:glycosyltransferase involved in cell wall biosynthesis
VRVTFDGGPPAQRARRWTRRGGSARVLIIVQNLPVPLDRRVWLECRSLVAAGYGVSVICPRAEGAPAHHELEGVRIHTYPPVPPTDGLASYLREFAYCWVRSFLLALRVAVTERFDVIQACNPPDTYFALALPFKLLGKPFVFDQHDLCPEVYQSRFARSSGPLLAGVKLLERCTYAVADHVISTNESYRRVAIGRGGKSPDSVTVVRSGPDPLRMRRATPRPELRRGRKHLCCYLGVMGPQDGVDQLLQSLRVLVHDFGRHDCHFALLGFGDCLESLRRLCTELELDDWVSFPGRADDQMICDYLSTADIGLSPDPMNPLNDVSTMNKTMEYMAYSLPGVAYDLAETRVSAERSAVYVKPGDIKAYAQAISDLLDQPDRGEAMGRIGRFRVEQSLAWQHQAAAYVGIYDALLDRPREQHTVEISSTPEEDATRVLAVKGA